MRAWTWLVACAACYRPSVSPGSPCSADQPCPDELVCSPATRTCERSAVAIDAPPDASVVGDGTAGSPFVAVAGAPTSCDAFLAAYPQQAGRDGVYRLAQLDAYCDMTTDGGGWTLVARVLSASTTHDTEAAIDVVTAPDQATTAKLADATTNAIGFAHLRLQIETVGTFYAAVTAVDFGRTEFMMPNAAAPALAGPYAFTYLTQITCTSDCGVAVARPDIGFGNNCGYRYFVSAGNPKPGMGCQGNAAKSGTAWVK